MEFLIGTDYRLGTRIMGSPVYCGFRVCLRPASGNSKNSRCSASTINKAVHLEEVILFNQQVFADTDLFSDMARYFSLLVIQTRILNKGRLFDAAVELFDRSLFSEPGFYSKAFHGLKLKLLETICRVLNDFNYDFTAMTRPILSKLILIITKKELETCGTTEYLVYGP